MVRISTQNKTHAKIVTIKLILTNVLQFEQHNINLCKTNYICFNMYDVLHVI